VELGSIIIPDKGQVNKALRAIYSQISTLFFRRVPLCVSLPASKNILAWGINLFERIAGMYLLAFFIHSFVI